MKKTLLSIIIILISLEVYSWTSTTHQKIAVEASRLTPYELKLLLHKHKQELLDGAISVLRGKKGENHFLLVDNSYGTAHLQIDKIVKSIKARIANRDIDLGRLAFEFGRLSSYMAEVNNPILTGDLKRRGGWFYTNFVTYTEKNINRFVLTFDGYRNKFLAEKDYAGFAIASAIRSAKRYPSLEKIYLEHRRKRLGYNFGPRSITFAVSSLSYNYAVTDTAKLWYYLWKDLSGDTSYAPYDGKRRRNKRPK